MSRVYLIPTIDYLAHLDELSNLHGPYLMNIALNINRKMVGLFFEIKRCMPFEQQESMKIAAPGIGIQLIKLHQESDSQTLKQLIEKFMQLAGDDWVKKLKTPIRSKSILNRIQATGSSQPSP